MDYKISQDLAFLVELVRANSPVIIPNLGAFLVKDLEKGFSIENVSFSPFLSWDDGILKQKIAARYTITEEEANARIKELVAYITTEQNAKGYVEIPEFGKLVAAPIQHFEAYSSSNQATVPPMSTPAPVVASSVASTSTQGNVSSTVTSSTAPAAATPVPTPSNTHSTTPSTTRNQLLGKQVTSAAANAKKKPNPPQKKANAPKPKPKIKQSKPKPDNTNNVVKGRKKRGWIIAFTLILLPLIAFALLYFLYPKAVAPIVALIPGLERKMELTDGNEKQDQDTHLQSENALGFVENSNVLPDTAAASATQTTAAQPTSKLEQTYNERATNSTETSAQTSEQTMPSSNTSTTPTAGGSDVRADASLPFQIIIASFQNSDNAHKYAEQLQQEGYSTSLIDRPDDMLAVSVGSYSSRAKAQEAFDRLSEAFPDAWILEQ